MQAILTATPRCPSKHKPILPEPIIVQPPLHPPKPKKRVQKHLIVIDSHMEHSIESLVRENEGTDRGVHEEEREESDDVVINPPEDEDHFLARTEDHKRYSNMPDFKAEVLNDQDILLVRTVDVDKMTDSVCNQYYQNLNREQS